MSCWNCPFMKKDPNGDDYCIADDHEGCPVDQPEDDLQDRITDRFNRINRENRTIVNRYTG